jgi:UDP-4-amino-4-deoxy-L-arabinose-oxoglutarate aminotransferase
LRRLAEENSITLLEDAAHAAGTEYRGNKIGQKGSAIFSFHPIKNMTCGEGGMFCSDNDKFLDKIRRLKFHGLGVDAYDRNVQGRAPQAEVLEPGYKYNLTDIAAVIGLGQLSRLKSFIEKRTLLARRYLKLLNEIDEISPLQQPDYPMRHAWHLFIIRLKNAVTTSDRQDFMEALKQRNIGTGLHFKAVHEQKFYRETLKLKPGFLPATEWNSQRICSLPLFPDMNLSDVDDVVDAIKEVLA